MRALVGVVPLSTWLLVAALAAGCAPTVDPALKADLDRRLASLPTSDQTYAPPEAPLPMAFAVGQWTQHRYTDDKGQPALVTYKLVGQEGGAYWIEIATDTYKGHQAVRLQVALLGGRDPSAMDIRSVRLKTGRGAPTDVPATAIAEYRDELDLLAAAWESQQQDDVRVPAGKFIGCYRSDTGTPWGPWRAPSTVCTHPAVPLAGVIRAQPTGRSTLMELVNFGLSGAESEF
jgi:hypothetical protein